MKLKFVSVLFAVICCHNLAVAESRIIDSGIQKNQLIELYTSEGCSSCPPADRWISKLKDNPRLWKDIIPVAFHVDYWDRLGWKDEMASKDFSERQRLYRAQGNLSQVYTPGFVVDGTEWRGFFRHQQLTDLETVEIGHLTAELTDSNLLIQFSPLIDISKNVVVHCAVLGFDISNEIGAGENRGRTLTHDFAVLGYKAEVIKSQHSGFNLRTKLPAQSVSAERKALVVWISEVNNLSPLQAAGDWL